MSTGGHYSVGGAVIKFTLKIQEKTNMNPFYFAHLALVLYHLHTNVDLLQKTSHNLHIFQT